MAGICVNLRPSRTVWDGGTLYSCFRSTPILRRNPIRFCKSPVIGAKNVATLAALNPAIRATTTRRFGALADRAAMVVKVNIPDPQQHHLTARLILWGLGRPVPVEQIG